MDTTTTRSEQTMWSKPDALFLSPTNDDQINTKYAQRELRVITEVNREQLPNFVAALQRKNWMDVRPFYQRRLRWDQVTQSKLIESFIMNVPIPPLFVYEAKFASYEVMDGQQRITAIKNFYSNKLQLKGLEQWPELNGRIYETLPSSIRKGIDRRSISYIVLLKESASTSEEELLLKQQVFERLNTGGTKLSNQEIRNALYHGKFNTMLSEAARISDFRKAWAIPEYSSEEHFNPSRDLLENALWSQMRDLEIVLRFFALRHVEHFRKGMAGFLDIYALRSRLFSDEDVEQLYRLFERTIELVTAVYAELSFRPWDKEKQIWSPRPQVAFGDAVMVTFSRYVHRSEDVIQKKDRVIEATKNLFESNDPGVFTGQGNTKADVARRITLFSNMIESVIGL